MMRFSEMDAICGPDELDSKAVRRRLALVKWCGEMRRFITLQRLLYLLFVTFIASIFVMKIFFALHLLSDETVTDEPQKVTSHQNISYCGTPVEVFQHFQLLDQSQRLINGAPLPGEQVLMSLPRPIYGRSITTQPVSYDPTYNQLCAHTYVELYTRFVHR